MNNTGYFLVGAMAGAAIGIGVTYILLKKENDEEDERLAETRHENALEMNEDELRQYYIDQLKDLGIGVIESGDISDDTFDSAVSEYEKKSKVNPIDDDEDEEEEEDEGPIEPNPDPYIISEDEYSNNVDYSSSTLHFYKGDGVWTNDDYEIIDNAADLLGDCCDICAKSDKEEEYVRSEESMVDYEIRIFDDSYAHAVEGEDEELGDMADDEEE